MLTTKSKLTAWCFSFNVYFFKMHFSLSSSSVISFFGTKIGDFFEGNGIYLSKRV